MIGIVFKKEAHNYTRLVLRVFCKIDMKLGIISPMKLPVPPTKGGAIETIIQQIVVMNEKYHLMDIECYTVSRIEQQPYRYTLFIPVKSHQARRALMRPLNNLNKLFSKIRQSQRTILDIRYKHIAKNAAKKAYDYIIFEGGEYACAKYFLKYYKKEQLVLHLHHVMDVPYYDNYFGNIICVSEFVKRKLPPSSHKKVQRICVLKNMVDPMLFPLCIDDQDKWKKRDKLGLDRYSKILLFCGRIIPEKGVKELILAYKKLQCKDAMLIIIGASNFGILALTSYEKEVKAMIKEDPSIRYYGYIPNDELALFYQAADLFIMPSIWEEPAGLVNMEALLCGLVPVTTTQGGIPEYVSKSMAALIAYNADFVDNLACEIDKLLGNDDLMAKKKACIRTYRKQISLENYYHDFYKCLAQQQ